MAPEDQERAEVSSRGDHLFLGTERPTHDRRPAGWSDPGRIAAGMDAFFMALPPPWVTPDSAGWTSRSEAASRAPPTWASTRRQFPTQTWFSPRNTEPSEFDMQSYTNDTKHEPYGGLATCHLYWPRRSAF